MLDVRRAGERLHIRRRLREAWLTFDPQADPTMAARSFGALDMLDENRLSPGASLQRQPRVDAEIITYLRGGSLAYEDTAGPSGVIQAGEFERTTTGRSTERKTHSNASSSDGAHVFQVWLRPSQTGLAASREHRRFSAAERRGRLCVVASPDARAGSLRLHLDALVCSAMLAPGTHLIHALGERRRAWVHVIEGELGLGDLVLSTGDGAGLTDERVVSLTAHEASEILVIDLGGDDKHSSTGGAP